MTINTGAELKTLEELAAMNRPELARYAAALLMELSPPEREAILSRYKTTEAGKL